MQKYIILDRDGVINQDSPHFVRSKDEWIPIPKSLEAMALLNKAGYKIIMITNQSGIGRGYFDIKALEAMHQKMQELLAEKGGEIERIYYCPHTPQDNCHCRKPKTGLFQQAGKDYALDFSKVINIGDSLRDIQAGKAMGCQSILVLTGKGKHTLEKHREEMLSQKVQIARNLWEAVKQMDIKDSEILG